MMTICLPRGFDLKIQNHLNQRCKVVRLSGCHPTGLVVEKGLISFDDAAHLW